jgi:hypothetical protein
LRRSGKSTTVAAKVCSSNDNAKLIGIGQVKRDQANPQRFGHVPPQLARPHAWDVERKDQFSGRERGRPPMEVNQDEATEIGGVGDVGEWNAVDNRTDFGAPGLERYEVIYKEQHEGRGYDAPDYHKKYSSCASDVHGT